MYLKQARSLVVLSLMNINTVELLDLLTQEEKDNLDKAWKHLVFVRVSLTDRIGNDEPIT